MDPRILRRLVLVVFVGGIAGMIVGSIADNNGVAVTFGLMTAVAAICLMLVTSVTSRSESIPFDETRAEAMEDRIQALVSAGADERSVRGLVRDAVLLGRSARRVDAGSGTSASTPSGSSTPTPGSDATAVPHS